MTITSITQANPAVVTAEIGGVVEGTWLRFTNVVGMNQISGMVFTATPITGSTFSIPLDSTSFASAATGGDLAIVFPSAWQPKSALITKITNARQAVVTTSTDHSFVVGQLAYLVVPPVFGMVQANKAVATVIATTASSMTLNLDSTFFDPWTFPSPSEVPYSPANVSNYGTRESVVVNSYDNTAY